MKNKDKNKIHLRFLWQYVLEFVLLMVGILVLIYGFNSTSNKNICYSEDNSLNYKVFLKDNNYFENRYLDEGKTYIASLIDFINVDYTYKLDFSDLVSGSYKYYLKATVEANRPNNEDGTYWSKDYILKEEVTKSFEDEDSFVIVVKDKIDYDKYNQILNSFKKEYDLDTDGKLTISLVVNTNIKNGEFTKDIPSKMALSIPLLEKAVNAKISKNIDENSNCIVTKLKNNGVIFNLIKFIGIGIIILSVVFMIRSVFRYRIFSSKNDFEIKLNKLLTNHDSIIASIERLPNLKDYDVVDVVNFNELIDVYNEVRMPINYCRINKKRAVFIIIKDKMAWKYEFENYK